MKINAICVYICVYLNDSANSKLWLANNLVKFEQIIPDAIRFGCNFGGALHSLERDIWIIGISEPIKSPAAPEKLPYI